jgi:hypothetical protein
MAYYITNAGFEIDLGELKYASLFFYMERFGLTHYITTFLHEEIDLFCVSIMEIHDLDSLNMNAQDKIYMNEFIQFYKEVIN